MPNQPTTEALKLQLYFIASAGDIDADPRLTQWKTDTAKALRAEYPGVAEIRVFTHTHQKTGELTVSDIRAVAYRGDARQIMIEPRMNAIAWLAWGEIAGIHYLRGEDLLGLNLTNGRI